MKYLQTKLLSMLVVNVLLAMLVWGCAVAPPTTAPGDEAMPPRSGCRNRYTR